MPAGAAPRLTVVSIARLPDSPGPLLTSLDQFPLFYEFTSSPEVTFNTDVTTGVCQSQNFDAETYQRLRLAHNVGTNFGQIEILPRVNAPFLDCTNATEVGTLKVDGLTSFAATGWNFLGRTVGPLAKAVFLPDELHATVLGTCCLGGSTRKFSPHGAVDPTSNPGSLSIVDENGNPTSGEVSGPGTVYVKTTSNNGDPIQNVPVTFDGETTVLTNANGIASFEWSATPGTSLIATIPDETIFEGEGFSCPNDIPEPTPNSAYRPLVCFTPSSVTFTAPSAASGSDLVVFNDVNIFLHSGNDQLFTNLVSFANTGTRASGKSVLVHRGHDSGCPTAPGWCTASAPPFETTLTDQGYTIIDGNDATAPLTSIGPDVKLIVLLLPRQTYSNAELNSLKAFVGGGGRILFVGEFATYFGFGASGVATENDFLTKMGSTMQNIGGDVDCLVYWSLTSLQPHQITAGLSEILLACSSILQPGPDDYALFYDTTGELVLGAVARLDLTPLPPDEVILTAAQGIDVATPSAQSTKLSHDLMGGEVVAKKPAVQR